MRQLSGDSAASAAQCGELPPWGLYVGVTMGIFGSVGINIGQNIQAAALQALPELERVKPHKSKRWIVGLTIFIAFSMLNFAALTLASASILVPLEAVQFVCNVAFGKVVRKMPIPPRMYGGVLMMCFGVGLAVYFGEPAVYYATFRNCSSGGDGGALFARESATSMTAFTKAASHSSPGRILSLSKKTLGGRAPRVSTCFSFSLSRGAN